MPTDRKNNPIRGKGQMRRSSEQSYTLLDSAVVAVTDLLNFDAAADALLSRFFKANPLLGQRDRGFVADICWTVLRQKRVLGQFAQTFPSHKDSVTQGARPISLPRRLCLLALLQLKGLVGVEQYATHGEMEVLRNIAGQLKDLGGLPAAVRLNLPEWLYDRLHAQYGETTEVLGQGLMQHAGLTLRVNTLKSNRQDLQTALGLEGLKTTTTLISPWGLALEGHPQLAKSPAFAAGMAEVQDEGSQLLALITAAKRGQMVADFCAGAGGKTLALGMMMKNTGRLYAFDVSTGRLKKLAPRLARSGLSNVTPIAIEHERDQRIKRLSNKFDRVLIDAPCSGMGTLRRNPDLKWRQTEKDLAELTVKQASILDSASHLLKIGGRLVYATCSLLAAENEDIVTAFLATHPQYECVPAATVLAEQDIALVSHETDDNYLRLLPHIHQTDGFFAAVLQRIA